MLTVIKSSYGSACIDNETFAVYCTEEVLMNKSGEVVPTDYIGEKALVGDLIFESIHQRIIFPRLCWPHDYLNEINVLLEAFHSFKSEILFIDMDRLDPLLPLELQNAESIIIENK